MTEKILVMEVDGRSVEVCPSCQSTNPAERAPDFKHCPDPWHTFQYWQRRAYDASTDRDRWAKRMMLLENRINLMTQVLSGQHDDLAKERRGT